MVGGRLDSDWRQQGWQYEAYSSLGSQWLMRGHGENPVLSAPAVKAAAEAHGGGRRCESSSFDPVSLKGVRFQII